MATINEKMTAVADAIRAKTGETGLLTLDGMAVEIAAIETGIKTDDATAVASDILSGKTAYVKGNKVTGNIPSKAAATITPKTTNQTIAAGTYLTGTQTIAGDSDLKAANIKKGVNIFGVAGSYDAVELNFNVVGGINQPTNPVNNTIWINTNVEISGWSFSYTEPTTTSRGWVWIKTALTSPGEFNALKENEISIYPTSISQYVDGIWVDKTGKIYKTDSGWSDFSVIPDFTYDGNYEIVNDSDEIIIESADNWKIRFLTSGTLTFTNLKSAADGIDVFCVGGGGGGGNGRYNESYGGGGGGGRTATGRNISVSVGTPYGISVGGGGAAQSSGGTSSAFSISASGGNGGNPGNQWAGGAGGSGGGGYGGAGGSNGGNGGGNSGGRGQGTTTREFAEDGKRLYAGGGGGSANNTASNGGEGGGGNSAYITRAATSGTKNTGGGGGGGNANGYATAGGAGGGSGIVVIRNKRG